jgi:Holliday junction resolvase RusA-like endonuclease
MNALPTIVLHLPIPPSANRIWRRVQGMRGLKLAPEYKAWIEAAGWTARMQLIGVPRIEGAFTAIIVVPSGTRRDLDNFCKPLFDLCQRVGAVANDNGLHSYSVSTEDRDDCLVALFDLGGPIVRKPATRTRKPVPRKPSAAKKKAAAARFAAVRMGR